MAETIATTDEDQLTTGPTGGYSWAADIPGIQSNPYIFDDPILGFQEEGDPREPGESGPVGDFHAGIREGDPPPILQSEVIAGLPDIMQPEAQSRLALEIFLNVDAAYGDASDIFLDDGSVNQETFIPAVMATLGLAAQAGPTGLDTTTQFLDILVNSAGSSLSDLQVQFDERQAEEGGLFSGPILAEVVDRGFSDVLGRTATKREQQAFTDLVLKLGDSVQGTTDLGLRAQDFARETAPEEAQLMDYRGAADSIMRVLGLG
tara:strand:- start:2743 stop:3528 length:786 start_codon:yes stop_codon:yes gene_type:complete